MSEPHERLDRAMEDRRLELRMSWTDLAKRASISPQALRSIRRGEYSPSRLTAQALDEALGWARGSVERVLAGGDPGGTDARPSLTVHEGGGEDDAETEEEFLADPRVQRAYELIAEAHEVLDQMRRERPGGA